MRCRAGRRNRWPGPLAIGVLLGFLAPPAAASSVCFGEEQRKETADERLCVTLIVEGMLKSRSGAT